MPELRDARQVAERYHVTPATVLAWARRGWVPCVRTCRRAVFFNVEEVESALRRRGVNYEGHSAQT